MERFKKITTAFVAALLMIGLTAPSVLSKKKSTVRDYGITVKSSDIYIPYHLYGIEKALNEDDEVSAVKIITRAGTIKFTVTSDERPNEAGVSEFFYRYGITPSSVTVKKIRKK